MPGRAHPPARRREQRQPWTAWALLALAALAAVLLVPDAALAQCAMCRTAVLNSPEGQRLARGLNDGIVFLLSVPFLVAGAIAFKLRRAHRRRS